MDLEVLRKKLDTYRNRRGRIVNVPDDLRLEVLLAWEQWTGPAMEFYRVLGSSYRGMASMIGKAKKLKREGFPTDGFKEVKVIEGAPVIASQCSGIEVTWKDGKLIRFGQVDQLVDFLKKVA